MATAVGVTISERILAGLVVDRALSGPLRSFPPHPESVQEDDDETALLELHTDALVATICEQIRAAAGDHRTLDAVGVALPGVVRNGVVEDAPNLPQLKGARIQELLTNQLKNCDFSAPVTVLNDADGAAAGLACSHGKLDGIVRVWTLGVGIGFGLYPFAPGVWEGGHTTVTLDEKENFCGCGGRGHIEGIIGHRAMRLRFLDMEPEEVFEAARNGDPRCVEFKRLWHKALAAGTASSIHMSGPGKFFLTGFNVRFVDLPMLRDYVQQMVRLSPLQSFALEVVEDDAVTRVIGAAVSAEQAANNR